MIPAVGKFRFTLVELLIVVAIIAILAAILLPSLNKAKAKAQEIACAGNLKQLGSTLHLYAADSSDWLPVAVWMGGANPDPGFDTYNWYANPLLMGYIGWNESISFSNPLPHLKVRFCPSENNPWSDFPEKGYKTLSYASNLVFGWGWYHRRTKINEYATPSKTFSFADSSGYAAGAINPATNVGADRLSYRHFRNFNCSYLDGHVGKVSYMNQPPALTPTDPFWGKFY